MPSGAVIKTIVIWYRERDGEFAGRLTQVFNRDGVELMLRPLKTEGLKSHSITLEDGERFLGIVARKKPVGVKNAI